MNMASFGGLLTFLLLGVIVAGLALLTSRWIGSMNGLRSRGRRLRVIEGAPLGKDRGVYLVAVGRKAIVVGSTPMGVSLLHTADEQESAELLAAPETQPDAESAVEHVSKAVYQNLSQLRQRLSAADQATETEDGALTDLSQPTSVASFIGADEARRHQELQSLYRSVSHNGPTGWRRALKRILGLCVVVTVLSAGYVGASVAGLAPKAYAAPDTGRVAAQVSDNINPLTALPTIKIDTGTADKPQEGLQTMQLMLLLTVLSIAPAILILTTCFTRIVVVLSFTRQALGTQQLPPNQVLIGLALFLSVAVMSPTYTKVNEVALQPYLKGEVTQAVALEKAAVPMKEFMLKQTRQNDLALMLKVMNAPQPQGPEDTPFMAVVPAFAISELKTAFTMGFVLFLPFIIIDLVVASTLMSMGMMMVPPTMIALPFKIILFVLADGWHLIVKSLFDSFIQ